MIDEEHDGSYKQDEGVTYQASWMEASGARCFQIMEAPNLEALNVWIGHWSDLVEFEVTPVLTSADYWNRTQQES